MIIARVGESRVSEYEFIF
ncbi:hypothetical protein YPPY113_1440, partial [Yersinia pestis PY-113]